MSVFSWKYVKPLKSKDDINHFESTNNVKLPDDIISCFLNHNGGRPDKKTFDTENSKERVLKTLLSFNEGDIETIWSAFSVISSTQSQLVPIASDPSGNFICYNASMQCIELWLHETDTTEKISDNFTAFLDMLY